MLITLKQNWTQTGTYGDPNTQVYGVVFEAESWVFDTATRTVTYFPLPTGGSYNVDQSSGGSDPGPTDISLDMTFEFHVYVNGPQRTGYFHDGQGGFTALVTTLVLTTTITGCTCFGDRSGGIIVTPSGMAGPFTYLWFDGPTTQNRALVPAGTYRVSVTDGPSGAIARATIQVGANPELTILVRKVAGSITLTVSGGVGLYTYLWSDGNTNRNRSGLPNGPYSCTITDALGCFKEIQVVVNNDVFYWSRNPITLALDAGNAYRADPTTKPNLTFLCEVWIEKAYLSGTFEQIGGVLEQPADRTGRTEFEVQALLDVFLQHHVPALADTGAHRADAMFRRFYLKYAESYGTTPVRAGTTVLAENYVLLGGLNFYESRQVTFAEVYQPLVMPFLTWEPPTKLALADQPEYLYYLVRDAADGFRFQVRVGYGDGTSEVVSIGGQDNVRRHEVYCQPVGYQQLGLAELAGDGKVKWWEMFVTSADGATVLSETRRFVLENRQFPRRRYFLFATSLGGMATYVATGDAQLDVEVSGEESTRSPTPGSDVLLGDTVVQTRQLRDIVKVSSGPIQTNTRIPAFKDLLLSRRVLLLQGGRWLPGFIKTKGVTIFDESKSVQAQEFEFYLTAEQLFTPALGPDQVTYA